MTANEQMNLSIVHVGQTRPGDDLTGRFVFDNQRFELEFSIFICNQANTGPQDRPTIDTEVRDVTAPSHSSGSLKTPAQMV